MVIRCSGRFTFRWQTIHYVIYFVRKYFSIKKVIFREISHHLSLWWLVSFLHLCLQFQDTTWHVGLHCYALFFSLSNIRSFFLLKFTFLLQAVLTCCVILPRYFTSPLLIIFYSISYHGCFCGSRFLHLCFQFLNSAKHFPSLFFILSHHRGHRSLSLSFKFLLFFLQLLFLLFDFFTLN